MIVQHLGAEITEDRPLLIYIRDANLRWPPSENYGARDVFALLFLGKGIFMVPL